jgi:hypothetical protein
LRAAGATYVFGVGEGSSAGAEVKATFSDVPSGHPDLLVRGTTLSRLWSQIQRRFYGDDNLSVRDETL